METGEAIVALGERQVWPDGRVTFRGVSNPREIVLTVDRAIHAFQRRQQPSAQEDAGV
jgi:hypothetical protein